MHIRESLQAQMSFYSLSKCKKNYLMIELYNFSDIRTENYLRFKCKTNALLLESCLILYLKNKVAKIKTAVFQYKWFPKLVYIEPR